MGNCLANANIEQTGNGEGNKVLGREDDQAEDEIRGFTPQPNSPGRPDDAPRQGIRTAAHGERRTVVGRKA